MVDSSSGKYNSLIRVTRIGKLYKLVKITRLFRVLKLFKSKGKLFRQLNSFFSLGEGFERLVFTLLIFLMLSHFMACFWIFTAQLSTNFIQDPDNETNVIPDPENNNWIIANGFSEESDPSKYVIAFYFTVTTISTVGYGDISGTNDYERGTCCVLMVLGVTFFSIASGTFTNLI